MSAIIDDNDLAGKELSVVIFGATGDLARKKLFPALYQLVLMGQFPRTVQIVGFGRSEVQMDLFLEKQCSQIKENPKYPKALFLEQISFCAGGSYDEEAGFEKLDSQLTELEGGPANRLFFMSVPPTVFGAVAKNVSGKARSQEGFTRVIIEKPFGRDSESFAQLDAQTSSILKESEIFRIDHYLGKEVVLNLMTLRFANQFIEPTMNRQHIESVEITFSEDLGTGGRGGYFDKFGIIRDIMQNHLLQVFVLTAMEPPHSPSADDVMAAKVNLLKCVETLDPLSAYLGQFCGSSFFDQEGYLDDPGVPDDSTCPTFAAIVLRVDNDRWRGVPFLMKAGKGLEERVAEVRITYKPTQYNHVEHLGKNELVCRIQPDEALYLKTFSKLPGLAQEIAPTVMDMRYSDNFNGAYLADAYERMFLNAAKGDSALFVSSNELVEAWRIFTPLLHHIDATKTPPHKYPFGVRNPPGYRKWSEENSGVHQRRSFMERLATRAGDDAALKKDFDLLDSDHNGFLDSKEIKELAKLIYDGRDPPPMLMKKLFGLLNRCPMEGTDITLDDMRMIAEKLHDEGNLGNL